MNFKLLPGIAFGGAGIIKIVSLVLLALAFGQTAVAMERSKKELNKDLLSAIYDDNSAKVIELITAGADVDYRDNDWTPLMYASIYGHLEIVKILLDNGADIDSKNHYGNTARSLAERHNNTAIIQLIDDKEKLNNVFLEAAKKGDTEVIKLIKNAGAYVNCKGDYGRTPLHNACCGGYLELARLLINNGANINARDNCYETPLLLACDYNKIELIKLLLSYGAYTNCKDNNDRTPLYFACLDTNFELAKLLIDHGADVNLPFDDGVTALNNACYNNNVELAKLLIDHGADINSFGKGFTTLHFACCYNKLEIAKLLIDNGADINCKDKDGKAALDYGKREYKDILIDILNKKHGKTQLAHQRMLGILSNPHFLSLDVTALLLVKRK